MTKKQAIDYFLESFNPFNDYWEMQLVWTQFVDDLKMSDAITEKTLSSTAATRMQRSSTIHCHWMNTLHIKRNMVASKGGLIMGWTSYFTNKTNKEECLDIIKNYKGSCRKYVMKGNTFYALMTTPDNQDWVLCLLTRRERGEFYYKDIQMNPYESSGTPMSILKEFRPSNDEDAEWLKKNIERATNEKTKTAYDFGDVLHCKTPDGYSIEWNGKRIDGDEEFYIRVEVLNPWASKRTKMYRLLKKEYLKEYAEDMAKVWDKPFEEIEASLQTKFNGKEYRFLDTNYRVAASTMKNIEVINKEVA